MAQNPLIPFDLSYEEQGDKQKVPLIFIHAFPMTRAMWEAQRLALPKDCFAISYDIRGFGKSPVGDAQFTMESYVADLLSLMDHLKIHKALLCGLSLGGYIALRAVEKYPDRVAGLILCDTRSEADNNAGKIKRYESIELLKNQGLQAFAKVFVPGLLSPLTLQKKPWVAEKIFDLVLSQDVRGVIAAQLAMIGRTDTTEAMASVRCPSLVIIGEKDPLIPVAQSEEMAKRIPGASFRIIPQAGHMSNMESPEEFNRVLLEFLKSFSKGNGF